MNNDFLDLYHKYEDRGLGYKGLMIDDVQTRGNKIIEDTNSLNNNLLETTGILATSIIEIRKRMSEISDMNLSVASVSGNTNSQFEVSSGNILDAKNIIKNNGELRISPLATSKASIIKVDISTNGHFGNSVDYEEKRNYNIDSITTDVPLEIESYSSQLVVYITATLSKKFPLNIIKMKSVDFGIKHFEVTSLDVTYDGKSYQRMGHHAFENNGDIDVEFQESSILGFRLTISQRNSYVSKSNQRRFPIGISNLSSGLKTTHESGAIIFGPFGSPREVLKCSMESSISTGNAKNVKFEVSNNGESWYELSMPYSDMSHPKHIDFNTIGKDSIRTSSPVNSLYARITLNAQKINKIHSELGINHHIQQVSKINNRIFLPFVLSDKYILGLGKGSSFGERISHSRYIDDIDSIDSVTSIKSESLHITKTIKPLPPINKATIRSSLHKCRLEKDNGYRVIPRANIDISTSSVYVASNPTPRSVRVVESSNIVLPFKEMAGIYTLTDGKIIRRIDLSSGFFESCFQWIYDKHDLDVYLINPIGTRVAIFEKEKTINLLNYFNISEPKHSDKSPVKVVFNKNFPSSKLEDNEFTIIDGKIRCSNNSAIINCHTVVYDKAYPEFNIGVNNASIYLQDVRVARTSEKLQSYSGSHIAKLSKSKILKGSVKFSNLNSSANSFIREVDYVNGVNEFNTGDKTEVRIPKNSNRFSLGRKVDHFSEINFIGYIDIFKSRVYSHDELINIGDYLLEDNDSETFIILPTGVRTHDIIETFAITDSPIASVGAGYYSIDYDNGILYSKSPISGETEVEYTYSNVFISGREIDILDKEEYSTSGRTIEIKNPSDDSSVIVLSKNEEYEQISIFKSPSVKNIILNTVTI